MNLVIGCTVCIMVAVAIHYLITTVGRRHRKWIMFKAVNGITFKQLSKTWYQPPSQLAIPTDKCIWAASIPRKPIRMILWLILRYMHKSELSYDEGVYSTAPGKLYDYALRNNDQQKARMWLHVGLVLDHGIETVRYLFGNQTRITNKYS